MSKIYKIVPKVETIEGDVYIGSTTKDINDRFEQHKLQYGQWLRHGKRNISSYLLFVKYGVENCKIELIEEVSLSDKKELLMLETYYINTMKCINKNKAFRTREEKLEYDRIFNRQYYGNNFQNILDRNKIYYNKNKSKILLQKKEKYLIKKNNLLEVFDN
jgi:ribosome-interacting GTPase 1